MEDVNRSLTCVRDDSDLVQVNSEVVRDDKDPTVIPTERSDEGPPADTRDLSHAFEMTAR